MFISVGSLYLLQGWLAKIGSALFNSVENYLLKQKFVTLYLLPDVSWSNIKSVIFNRDNKVFWKRSTPSGSTKTNWMRSAVRHPLQFYWWTHAILVSLFRNKTVCPIQLRHLHWHVISSISPIARWVRCNTSTFSLQKYMRTHVNCLK